MRTFLLAFIGIISIFLLSCSDASDSGQGNDAESGDHPVLDDDTRECPDNAPDSFVDNDAAVEDTENRDDTTDFSEGEDSDSEQSDGGDEQHIDDDDVFSDNGPDEDAECVNGTKEYRSCTGGGMEIRSCENGAWGEYSDCFNINDTIIQTASTSACASYSWKDRGRAPSGYVKGMGLLFAGAVCSLYRSDVVVVSSAKTDDALHDALAWYDTVFSNVGMDNSSDGIDTLRHLYTLLIGLGMRESSGKHCEGRDQSATNTTADTAEAGLFQTSYNSHVFSNELNILFSDWKNFYSADTKKCLLSVFSEQVSCGASSWESYGSGDGFDFQELEKKCPAFAVEYAAVMLRVSGGSKGHYGPLRRHDAEVRTECDSMFHDIQNVVITHPDYCRFLNNVH